MGGPLFIKVEEYNEVIDLLKQIEGKLEETKKIIEELNQIKNEEDAEINSWQQNITAIEEKTRQINQLFGQE